MSLGPSPRAGRGPCRTAAPFTELTEIYQIDADFKAKVDREFDAMLARAGGMSEKVHS